MAAKMQTITSTSRFLIAKSTRRSIIEEHPALHDDSLSHFEAACDDGLIALLEAGLDRACFENPWRDLNEHLIQVILQNECHRWDDQHCLRRGEEADIGEHVGL